MRPSAGEAYSDLIASGPDTPPATGYGWGNAKGVTGPVGPGKDVTNCHRVRTASPETEARTHAPVRSPDRDGNIDDGGLKSPGGDGRTHRLSAVLRMAVPRGLDPVARTPAKRWMLQRPPFVRGFRTRRGKLHGPLAGTRRVGIECFASGGVRVDTSVPSSAPLALCIVGSDTFPSARPSVGALVARLAGPGGGPETLALRCLLILGVPRSASEAVFCLGSTGQTLTKR